MVIRLMIPVLLIGVGIFSFIQLSIPEAKEEKEKQPDRKVRTNVVQLQRQDYQIVIQANGLVQPFNEVTLSAEVAGLVKEISPRFEVGAYFAKDDVLVVLDDRDYQTALSIAEANLKSAQAAEQLANQTFLRLSSLAKKNNISEAEVMEAEAGLKQASATLDTSRADLAQAKRNLERTHIRAPFDGRVRQKTIGIGQSVNQGSPLGIAFSVDFAEVRLPLSSNERQFLELPELESDPPLVIELVNALDPNSNETWTANIVRTEGTLDVDSLELFAIARIKDPFGRESGQPPLRLGQPVAASIPGELLENVVALPRSAVRQLDRAFFVDNDELTLFSRTLKPLWSNEESVIVQDPTILEGDLLATTSLVYAPEGAEVEIIPDIDLTASNDDLNSQAESATN